MATPGSVWLCSDCQGWFTQYDWLLYGFKIILWDISAFWNVGNRTISVTVTNWPTGPLSPHDTWVLFLYLKDYDIRIYSGCILKDHAGISQGTCITIQASLGCVNVNWGANPQYQSKYGQIQSHGTLHISLFDMYTTGLIVPYGKMQAVRYSLYSAEMEEVFRYCQNISVEILC